MSSSAVPQGALSTFSNNDRLVIGSVITFIHASVVVFILFGDIERWRFASYTIIPTLGTVVVPFLVTEKVIKRRYASDSLSSYFDNLSKSTDDSDPVIAEVEVDSEVLQQLPDDVSDPDSVMVVEGELLDNVDGEEFDPVDANTRGIIAIAFASLLIIPSALIVGWIIDGVPSTLIGIVVAIVASAIVLQQHHEMVDVIEYTSKSVDYESE